MKQHINALTALAALSLSCSESDYKLNEKPEWPWDGETSVTYTFSGVLDICMRFTDTLSPEAVCGNISTMLEDSGDMLSPYEDCIDVYSLHQEFLTSYASSLDENTTAVAVTSVEPPVSTFTDKYTDENDVVYYYSGYFYGIAFEDADRNLLLCGAKKIEDGCTNNLPHYFSSGVGYLSADERTEPLEIFYVEIITTIPRQSNHFFSVQVSSDSCQNFDWLIMEYETSCFSEAGNNWDRNNGNDEAIITTDLAATHALFASELEKIVNAANSVQ